LNVLEKNMRRLFSAVGAGAVAGVVVTMFCGVPATNAEPLPGGEDETTVTSRVYTGYNGGEDVHIDAMQCPASHPYLLFKDFPLPPELPRATAKIATGVSLNAVEPPNSPQYFKVYADKISVSGFATGLAAGNSFSYEDLAPISSIGLSVTLHCTSNVPRTYPSMGEATPVSGAVGQAYSYQFPLNKPAAPTIAVTSGALPPGLTLSPSGLLSGTPLSPGGTHNFTVTVTSVQGLYTQSLSIKITGDTINVPTPEWQIPPSAGLVPQLLPDKMCPADHPYLDKHNRAPGRAVPNGVEVIEPNVIGVSSFSWWDSSNTYQTGLKTPTATNFSWWNTWSVRLVLHCTNDLDEASRGWPG
jgi:hypothetical protein